MVLQISLANKRNLLIVLGTLACEKGPCRWGWEKKDECKISMNHLKSFLISKIGRHQEVPIIPGQARSSLSSLSCPGAKWLKRSRCSSSPARSGIEPVSCISSASMVRRRMMDTTNSGSRTPVGKIAKWQQIPLILAFYPQSISKICVPIT